MIYSWGDLHLDLSRPWGLKVSEETVKFIINHPSNTKGNVFVFLGDLTEKSTATGLIYSLLMELFSGLNVDEAIVLLGNHDGKLENDGTVNILYDFLTHDLTKKIHPKIKVITEPMVLDLQGVHSLFLPHIFPDGKRSLKDYEDLPVEIANQEYDVIFGHFMDTTRPPMGGVINIEYLKTEYHCFGHDHSPSDHYQGSLVANSVAEAGQKKQIQTFFMKNGKVHRDIEIIKNPICDYYSVKFPEPLPDTTAIVPIWTIYNCKSESVAINHYGDIFIRNCVYDLSLDKEALEAFGESISNKSTYKVSILELFEEFIKGHKYPNNIIEESKSLLIGEKI